MKVDKVNPEVQKAGKVRKNAILKFSILAVAVVMVLSGQTAPSRQTIATGGVLPDPSGQLASAASSTPESETSQTGEGISKTGIADSKAGSEASKAGPETSKTALKTPAAEAEKPVKLPLLLDLGAGKCIPCKMMVPILAELEAAYKGVMEVRFIDVWKAPEEGQKYSVRIIPTQIFFTPDGRELFRHEGFFAKEDILSKWRELGFDLKPSSAD